MHAFRIRVQGSGFLVQDSGFRVWERSRGRVQRFVRTEVSTALTSIPGTMGTVHMQRACARVGQGKIA